ncbi:hypothetical protein WA026_000737 [Henosepilachna vigintioctopunctata]|uniref:Uncharacterized protein n=1 Tax=Henosepilachna vigintioctopunctata TaxID=420089 RepID=A0AAW1V644_9CUCU
MADEGYKVRVLERLKIKIGEAKNLPARNHGSSSQRDVYCTLSLDQEEIFRTSTIEKSLCPFFGEEFQFEVPRNFRYVSVYVFDRDRHLKQDKVLGKVAIKREDLASYNNKDHWFPIKAVDADSEVQGKANIEIKFEPSPSSKSTNSFSSNRQLSVRVLECLDLPLKCGSCEPYAFEEVFTFDSVDDREKDRDSYSVCPESEVEICELQVAIWHNAPGMGGDIFLGEVRVQLRGRQQQNAAHKNAWYFLQPRSTRNRPSFTISTPPGTRLSCDNSLGSLRLQVQYTEDKVFPAEIYDPLRRMLLQSVHTTPITSSAVYILGEVISSKMDIAQPLVKIFMHHNEVVSIIRLLANHEVSGLTDATTIFRGNTLVSKMMDEAMRLIGLRYLHKTLRPTLDLIFSEKKPCEIDPTRIKDSNTIQANLPI